MGRVAARTAVGIVAVAVFLSENPSVSLAQSAPARVFGCTELAARAEQAGVRGSARIEGLIAQCNEFTGTARKLAEEIVRARSITLHSLPSLALRAPASGETLTAGQAYTVWWTAMNLAGKTFALWYSGTSAEGLIATGITGTSYEWNVPASFSGQYALRVEAVGMESVQDWSDAAFTVVPGAPSGSGGKVELRVNGSASSATVARGMPLSFVWSTASDIKNCLLTEPLGRGATNDAGTRGSYTTPATESGPYYITCFDLAGQPSRASVAVNVTGGTVTPPAAGPTVTFTVNGTAADKLTVATGASVAFSWSATNATGCFTNFALAGTGTSGRHNVVISQSGNYAASCYDAMNRSASKSVAITVRAPAPDASFSNQTYAAPQVPVSPPPPVSVPAPVPAPAPAPVPSAEILVALYVNGAKEVAVPSGEKVKFNWSSSGNAARCEGSGLLSGKNIGAGTSGQYEAAVAESGAYSVTCYDAQNRSNSDSATVRVAVSQSNEAPSFDRVTTNDAIPFPAGSTMTWLAFAKDPDGVALSYAADWGDGTPIRRGSHRATGAGASSFFTFEHAYGAAGNYTITFTATDDKGATARTTKGVVVSPARTSPAAVPPVQPPAAVPTGPLSLSSAVIENGVVRVVYSKSTPANTSAHVVSDATNAVLGVLWENGTNKEARLAFGYAAEGMRLKLCNPNNYGDCSSTVAAALAAPSILLKANNALGSATIPKGTSAPLEWSSMNMIPGTCTLNQGIAFPPNGSPVNGTVSTGAVSAAKTFTITCSPVGGGAPVSASVAVDVGPESPPVLGRISPLANMPAERITSGPKSVDSVTYDAKYAFGEVMVIFWRTTNVTSVDLVLKRSVYSFDDIAPIAKNVYSVPNGGGYAWIVPNGLEPGNYAVCARASSGDLPTQCGPMVAFGN